MPEWLITLLIAVGGLLAANYARLQLAHHRQEAAERREQHRIHARRDAWRPEYESAVKLLIDAADLAYRVCSLGPLTHEELKDIGAQQLHYSLDQASKRVLEEVREPLERVARHVCELLGYGLASEEETLDLYERVRSGAASEVPPHGTITAQRRMAGQQTLTASELEQAVATARTALTRAWGG
ncbi:hypothetical protein [Streptomyces sp. T028]|uniref:hypothetical protein n=1 Tax=Streptomyces sp. T028 TaxID=3394379 RepID=UPI003A85A477